MGSKFHHSTSRSPFFSPSGLVCMLPRRKGEAAAIEANVLRAEITGQPATQQRTASTPAS